MSESGQGFTAAEIANAIGVLPQSVRRSMRGSRTSEVKIVNGQEARAWTIAELPDELRVRLENEARERGYRNTQTLLDAPLTVWPPADFPSLDRIAKSEIDKAAKLRQALMPFLLDQRRGDSAAEWESRGVAEYARVFGHKVSARHWRRLFKRTLQRDAGAENFSGVQLYLPDQPALAEQQQAGESEQFQDIADCIDAFESPAAPSDIERRAIWTLTFDHLARLTRQGMPPKRAARVLRNFLIGAAPVLAPTRGALLKAFKRKLERWTAAGEDPKALRDGREENGEQFDLPDDDRDLLIHRAVFYYRGDIAPAWRDCLKEGFSEPTKLRYAGKAVSKSHVPARIRDLARPEVEVLTIMHQGRKAFDGVKGYVSRSYDGIASLQCLQADDFTLNSYFYFADGDWFTLTRGQVILFIDFRSLRVLGWALEPHKSYSSLTIRSQCTHVFTEYGLPQVLYFERGIWKTAKIIKGALNFGEISHGLREFGIRFMHAVRPRTKTIERVGGIIQDSAEAEPGYSGRDERRDAPESLGPQMAAVAARRVHPSKYFYSFEQWNRRLGELFEQYNAEPQQGRILAGLSPDQAFEKFMDPSNPPIQFDARTRYLLAHDKRQVAVTLNGITIRVGKRAFNYRGREIAHLVGREALAWFDPENPDVLAVTDLDRQNPVCVSLSEQPNALESLIEPKAGTLKRELARVGGQASYMKTRYNVIKSKFQHPERKLLLDAQTVDLGREIASQKATIRETTARQTIDMNRRRRAEEALGTATLPGAQLSPAATESLERLAKRYARDLSNERADP